METVAIDESIRVGAAFDRRRILPVWFMWRNRYYKVKDVCFVWSTDSGRARVCHYSVTDGDNTYELRFDTTTLEWTLGGVCTE